MTISRYEPLRLFSLLNRDLGHFNGQRAGQFAADASVADWMPAVDIVEHTDRFALSADLPGVASDAIDIRMEDGILSLAGERHRASNEETDGVRRYERSTGKFLRRFTLPDTADAENISARCENGILEVSIPKRPEVQARRITVEAA